MKKNKCKYKSLILSTISTLLVLEVLLLFMYRILATQYSTNNSIRNTSCKLIMTCSIIFVIAGIVISIFLWVLSFFKQEQIEKKDYRNYESEMKYRNYQNVYNDMEEKKKKEQQRYRYSTEKEAKLYREQTVTQNGLFDGLDEKNASRKFKELIKKYHPDNGGSAEITEKIMEEYKKYKRNIQNDT